MSFVWERSVHYVGRDILENLDDARVDKDSYAHAICLYVCKDDMLCRAHIDIAGNNLPHWG